MKQWKLNLISACATLGVAGASAGICFGVITTPNYINESHILEVGDIYGEIPGYGDDFFTPDKDNAGAIRIADSMQRIVSQYPGSVILNNGDAAPAGVFSMPSKGETTYKTLKAMDVRYSSVGNHEWDWDENHLSEKTFDSWARTDKTEGNYFLASNLLKAKDHEEATDWDEKAWITDPQQEGFAQDYQTWKDSRVSWADPYKVIDMNGHNVCIFGLTTQETINDSNVYATDTTAFINYEASITYSKLLLKETIGEERFNEIESFILLAHCGAITEDTVIKGEVGQLAENINTDIDVILAAHKRTDVVGKVYNNKLNKPITIVETTDKMKNFADVKLVFDDSKPKGSRLIGIEAKNIAPKYDYSSQEAAAKQLQELKDNPFNDVVKSTINTYEEQKSSTEQQLDKTISTSTNGLAYSQVDKYFDYEYCKTIVDPAGAFLAKMFLDLFPIRFQHEIEKEKIAAKPNIALIGNDSIHQEVAKGDVKMKDLYGLFPYSNSFVEGTLTYSQLEEVVEYMFSGKSWDKQERLTGKYYTQPIHLSATETLVVPQLRTPTGPTQFYGMCFTVKYLKDPDEQGRIYEYQKDSLKVYVPDETGCDINKPDTWKDSTYFTGGSDPHLIYFIMNSFNYGGGNNQFKLLQAFADYNIIHHSEQSYLFTPTSEDIRMLCDEYITEKAPEGFSFDISNDVLEALISGREEQ